MLSAFRVNILIVGAILYQPITQQ